MRALVVALLAAAACSHAPPGRLRFVEQPPVWKVDDARPLAHAPKVRVYNRTLYQLDGFIVRRATRAMDLIPARRALDINSVEEVPDSTWFTNRIGMRDVSTDELRRGPNVDESPALHLPWTITTAKTGGTALGFIMEDARHQKYLLKFDEREVPELETGAHIVSHRLLWAAGYNVPQDYLAYIGRGDLRISPKATVKDALGNKQPLTDAMLDLALKRVFTTDDGKLRVLVSKFVDGKPIGPYAREGTRHDDPNDVIPHERRRSVRGQIAIFSWLNHTDIQEDNSLDSFADGHVVHYLIDFGKALGVMNNSNHWKTVGYTYRLDVSIALRSIFTFGLWDHPWDHVEAPGFRGVAVFDAAHFDPSEWQINSPYWPFDEADRVDGFWGAKIVARFTRDQIAAAVDEAHYSDPRAAAYIVDTLVERQHRVAAYWFAKVSPLDRFTVTVAGDSPAAMTLCFDDLALAYKLAHGAPRYDLGVYDYTGRPFAVHTRLTEAAGHVCLENLPLAPEHDHYTMVRLAARRNRYRALPAVTVHVARTARGIEVIGVRRD